MPDFRVIDGASDPDLRRRRADDDLRWPTKEIASKIMPVVRGAGQPVT